ncbi:hypothetical protein [Leuconostoc carnosum]|uniref:hypothetical protein n=1 Tax=Leuconostoc carnosum TaxID=1252 RepID=UPI00161B3AB9|nr:hypothetical protein [Leuconostoc carnosum]MBB6432451.1 putative nucleic acid-binding Zn-ribbon protein [Leuconostoc carnosum]
MKILDNIKNLSAQLKEISRLLNQLKAQQKNLVEQVDQIKTTSDEIQVEIEKMNFKNKPHSDRIKETTEHLNDQLSKFKA